MLLTKRGQKVKNIGADEIHFAVESVSYSVGFCHFNCLRRNIHCRDMSRAAHSCIQRKRACVGETIKYFFAARYFCYCEPIIFLIKEKARFLTVFNVHLVYYSVFGYLRYGRRNVRSKVAFVPALVFGKSFKRSYGYVVALKYSGKFHVPPQKLACEYAEYHMFSLFYTVRQHLNGENSVIIIDGQTRNTVRFAENKAAGGNIIAHNGDSVIERIRYTACEKRFVKAVVCVPCQKPYFNLALFAVYSGAEI